MVDFLTKDERSKRMAMIRGSGTKCEKAVRKLLMQNKIRHFSQVSNLIGKPDFVLKDVKLAIFVDGGFWHGRKYREWKTKLSVWWQKKIERNIARDCQVSRSLRRSGYSVIRLWEADVRSRPEWCVCKIRKAISRVESSRTPR